MNQAGMNHDIRESLSAAIDGELSAEQLRFLLRRIDHDTSLEQAWGRFHVARDSMRGELAGTMASASFSSRVLGSLEHGAVSASQPARRNRWLRWSAGGAIAASVAAAALMIGQPLADGERLTASSAEADKPVLVNDAASKPTAPATVPPWLSGNSAGLLSQQASATLGSPYAQQSQRGYARRLSDYPSMPRYRTFDNNDGSYLLLLDPEQQVTPLRQRRASAGAQ